MFRFDIFAFSRSKQVTTLIWRLEVIELDAKVVLLDIEGTTSSVTYVYDVLFPFARKNLQEFLERRWLEPAVKAACERLACDVGDLSLADSIMADTNPEETRKKVIETANRLMDDDVKATGLKELQGMIWEEGYSAGQLKSHVYPDVAPALREWNSAGLSIRIFSSGSMQAQKVFFQNTEDGNLSSHLTANYDTTTGPKRDAQSYKLISQDAGVEPVHVTFLSDVVEELDAAREAGMSTILVVRPGNHPLSKANTHMVIETFDQLKIGLPV